MTRLDEQVKNWTPEVQVEFKTRFDFFNEKATGKKYTKDNVTNVCNGADAVKITVWDGMTDAYATLEGWTTKRKAVQALFDKYGELDEDAEPFVSVYYYRHDPQDGEWPEQYTVESYTFDLN